MEHHPLTPNDGLRIESLPDGAPLGISVNEPAIRLKIPAAVRGLAAVPPVAIDASMPKD